MKLVSLDNRACEYIYTGLKDNGLNFTNLLNNVCGDNKDRLFTILPDDMPKDRVYSFRYGGLSYYQNRMPMDKKHISPCTVINNYLIEYIRLFLSRHSSTIALSGDPLGRASDPWVQKKLNERAMLFNNEEIYYYLTDRDKELISNFIKWSRCSIYPPSAIVLSEIKDKSISMSFYSDSLAEELATNLRALVVCAYDNESYIFLEKKEMPNFMETIVEDGEKKIQDL